MPRPTRRTGSERRGEIADAVLRLWGRAGGEAVTAATIAAEVGVTPGALFRHFKRLDEIVTAAVEVASRRLEAGVPVEASSSMAELRAFASARARLLREEPGIAWLLRSEQAAASLPTAATTRLRGAIRRSRTWIRAALERGVEAGDLRGDVGVGVLLAVFTATVHSLPRPLALGHRVARRPNADALLAGLFTLLRPLPTESRR